MDDDDNVINLFSRSDDAPMSEHFITCRCGSPWLHSEAFTIGRDGRPNGFSVPVTCNDCGAEVDLSSLPRWTP